MSTRDRDHERREALAMPELTVDAEGRPRAAWPGDPPAGADLLTAWLESDIHDPATCARILERARAIVAAGTGSWRASGNGFALLVGPRRALLFPHVAPPGSPPARVPTPQLVRVLEGWLPLL